MLLLVCGSATAIVPDDVAQYLDIPEKVAHVISESIRPSHPKSALQMIGRIEVEYGLARIGSCGAKWAAIEYGITVPSMKNILEHIAKSGLSISITAKQIMQELKREGLINSQKTNLLTKVLN